MTPEGATLKACLDYLAIHGIAAWRINTMGTPLHDGSGKYRPAPSRGIADIIAVGPGGRAIAIEVKSARGKQSPAQREFQRKWERAGGVYFLVREVGELRALKCL